MSAAVRKLAVAGNEPIRLDAHRRPRRGDETTRLLAELESLSDEEAERLLAGEEPR